MKLPDIDSIKSPELRKSAERLVEIMDRKEQGARELQDIYGVMQGIMDFVDSRDFAQRLRLKASFESTLAEFADMMFQFTRNIGRIAFLDGKGDE